MVGQLGSREPQGLACQGRGLGLPPATYPKLMTKLRGRHLPSMVLFHDFCTGVHPTQPIMALRPQTMLREMRMNHVAHFTQPLAKRSMVMANAVLLQVAAVMVNVVRTIVMTKLTDGSSQGCLPYPVAIMADKRAQSMMWAICGASC